MSSTQEKDHNEVFGANVTNTKAYGIHESNWIDRNSIINIMLLSISGYGFFFTSYKWLVFTWVIFLLLEDFLFFSYGISIFSTEIGIKRGYQFVHLFLEHISGHGRDLGFNLYDGNLNKTLKQSQVDKYEYIVNHLKIKKGMKILDCGCGYGDWLNYLKTHMECEVAGINISPEQASFASKEYGLEIYNVNWKQVLVDKSLQSKLYNRFDCVTFMDTVEHYVSGKDRKNFIKQGEIYGDMFKMAHNLLNKQSKLQKIFISCLHQNERLQNKWGFKANISSYFLTRNHSGYYPIGKNGVTKHGEKYFKVIDQSDKTEDYRLTAVLDNQQFQAPKIEWNLKRFVYLIILFVLDPHHLHRWVDIYADCWMNLYGEDVYSKEYNVKQRAKTSIVILWWITLESKRIRR